MLFINFLSLIHFKLLLLACHFFFFLLLVNAQLAVFLLLSGQGKPCNLFAPQEMARLYRMSAHFYFVSDLPDIILFHSNFHPWPWVHEKASCCYLLSAVVLSKRWMLLGFKLYVLISVQDACSKRLFMGGIIFGNLQCMFNFVSIVHA